jgi:hypothetical protein
MTVTIGEFFQDNKTNKENIIQQFWQVRSVWPHLASVIYKIWDPSGTHTHIYVTSVSQDRLCKLRHPNTDTLDKLNSFRYLSHATLNDRASLITVRVYITMTTFGRLIN